jgi:zinc/manganese transport system ATP-binding protein
MLEVNNLSVYYKKHRALHNISGCFQAGSMTAIIGPNGGGKSTLLKALAGLVPVATGHILYHGISRKNIAYLPQLSEVDRSFPLSVHEVVALGHCHQQGFFRHISPSLRQKVDEALSNTGMAAFKERGLDTLSGGQFQRVLFARLAVQQADILLLDEPFAGIDPQTIEDLMQILLQWNQTGKTIIMVSHDLDLVHAYFPQTLLLTQRCLGWGATAEIVTNENIRTAKHLSRNWEDCIVYDGIVYDGVAGEACSLSAIM